MTNQESYPTRPARTSTFDRLASMPTPQEMLRPHHTTKLRYRQSTDSQGFPVVEEELPFIATDRDARWMSAEEVAAYIQQAEDEALAELDVETSSLRQGEKRQLRVRYDGPDAHIKLQVTEGMDGQNIDRILGAFTGMTGQQVRPTSVRPSQEPYYLESAAPAMQLPPAIPVAPAEMSAIPSYSLEDEAEVYYQDQEPQPLTLGTMFDSAPAAEKRTPGFISRHRKGIAGMIAIATAPLWYQSVGDVAYEAARQGINGEMISGVEAFATLRGQEINEEKE